MGDGRMAEAFNSDLSRFHLLYLLCISRSPFPDAVLEQLQQRFAFGEEIEHTAVRIAPF